jgi:hypothetical protein
VTMSRENKNRNGERTIETNLIGRKARKMNKNKAKIERLQQVPGGTLQKEKLNNFNFTEISEQ